MSDIVIVGGGFAGVWAAAAATRLLTLAGALGGHRPRPSGGGRTRSDDAAHTVTLVTPGDDLVIRPRLYEAAPHTKRVPLDRILGPAGVRRTKAYVTGIDTARRTLTATGRDGEPVGLRYDRLVLATGSRLVRPAITGAAHLHDVDTLGSATALDAHLHSLPDRPPGPGRFTAVVVGAGFTGLETATELVSRLRRIAAPYDGGAASPGSGAAFVPPRRPGRHPQEADEVRVVLVDHAGSVGPGLGPGPKPVIARALHDLRIETRLGTTVTGVDARSATLSDGSRIAAHTVVWAAGVEAGPLAGLVPGMHDRLGRLVVDPFLHVIGVPGVWASGDVAAAPAGDGRQTMPSSQHAVPLGKFAGHNAAADLLGLFPEPFTAAPHATFLDLGAAGALYSTGWERTVRSTGREAKKLKRIRNEQEMYPPLDDPAELLRQADHRFDRLTADPGQATPQAS